MFSARSKQFIFRVCYLQETRWSDPNQSQNAELLEAKNTENTLPVALNVYSLFLMDSVTYGPSRFPKLNEQFIPPAPLLMAVMFDSTDEARSKQWENILI